MARQNIETRIGKLLIELGYVTPTQMKEASEARGKEHKRIWDTLMDLGYLSEEKFLSFLGSMPGTPSIELDHFSISQDVLRLIPKKIALDLEAVPIERIGDSLTVAMVCPIDEQGRNQLEKITGLHVKTVLCSRSDVNRVLDQHYRDSVEIEVISEEKAKLSIMDASLKLRGVAEFAQTIEDLPTLPDIMAVISSLVDDPDTTAADLAEVISSDSALSGGILKLANSAAFGFSGEISSIKRAITLLGFKQAQALALTACVFDQFESTPKFDLKTHWNHSFACATLAKSIASALNREWNETAYLAGLFHDMGKLAIAINAHKMDERFEATDLFERLVTVEEEEAALGINHAEAGYLLGEHWNLPAALTDAIRFHHSPELTLETPGLANVVFLADLFCEDKPAKQGEGAPSDNKIQEALEALDLSKQRFLDVLKYYRELATEIKIF